MEVFKFCENFLKLNLKFVIRLAATFLLCLIKMRWLVNKFSPCTWDIIYLNKWKKLLHRRFKLFRIINSTREWPQSTEIQVNSAGIRVTKWLCSMIKRVLIIGHVEWGEGTLGGPKFQNLIGRALYLEKTVKWGEIGWSRLIMCLLLLAFGTTWTWRKPVDRRRKCERGGRLATLCTSGGWPKVKCEWKLRSGRTMIGYAKLRGNSTGSTVGEGTRSPDKMYTKPCK